MIQPLMVMARIRPEDGQWHGFISRGVEECSIRVFFNDAAGRNMPQSSGRLAHFAAAPSTHCCGLPRYHENRREQLWEPR